jgi:hypothetical protein
MHRRRVLKAGILAALFRSSLRLSFGQCPPQTSGIQPDRKRYIDGIATAEKDRENTLSGYTSREVYTVYRSGKDPAATRTVRARYVKGQGKTYTEIDRTGSTIIQSRLLDRLLKEQLDLSKPGNREKALLSSDNYQMTFECMETSNGRSCARLAVTPRIKSKYVIEGHILIDANTCHLVHVEGKLAVRPTLWATNPEIAREYSDRQGFFLATQVTSLANSVLLGKTQVVITYSYDHVS